MALAREVVGALTPAVLRAGELRLSCDRLLPPAERGAALAGRTLRQSSSVPGQLECRFERPAPVDQQPDVIGVDYACGERVPTLDFAAAAAALHAEPLALGAGGLVAVRGSAVRVSFRDADTPCQVDVDSPSGGREATLELARAVERALTADSWGE